MTLAGADIELRPFQRSDVPALGNLFAASRASMGLFEDPYSPSEHMGYIAGLSVGCVITVAEVRGTVAGFLSFAHGDGDGGLISHLFVGPDHKRQGVGRALLKDAMKRFGRPIDLWCFEANHPARALYEAFEFQAVEFRDGSHNDEGLPDVRYRLAPS